MQLSHSRVEKFSQCPRSYRLHYVDKIRSTTTTSALFFGSAIGLVLNAICLRKKDNPTDEELAEIKLGENELEYFDTLIETIEINRISEPLEKSSNIRYYRKDYNPSILTEEDLVKISEYVKEVGLELGDRPAKFEDFIDEYLSNQIQDTDILSFMNYQFYLSLRRKGQMMINEFMTNFYQKIVKVHSIEREIKIDMSLQTDPEYTDFLIGYIDMEASYRLCDEYDKKFLKDSELEAGDIIDITADFKTSSTRYGTKKLTESSQLARYNFVAKNPYQGYFVFVKTLKTPKRGNRQGETHVDIQVLFGPRNKELEDTVMDRDEIIIEKIENGEFPKIDEKSCRRVFGQFCQNYNYCHDNKNMRNLIKL